MGGSTDAEAVCVKLPWWVACSPEEEPEVLETAVSRQWLVVEQWGLPMVPLHL